MARRRKTKPAQAAVVGSQPAGQETTRSGDLRQATAKQESATTQKKHGNKNKSKPLGGSREQPCLSTTSSDTITLTTTSAIASSPALGHKLRLLLLDLTTLNKNRSAAKRLDQTLSMHYIAAPYFTPSEASLILNAIIDVKVVKTWRDHCENLEEKVMGRRFEDGVGAAMEGFLEKRRASGDARPRGPHHIGPLYAGLFGIRLEELEDERFLTRARREGFWGERR